MVLAKNLQHLRCTIYLKTFLMSLGLFIGEFKMYLESKFTESITWKNYGRFGGCVDHIRLLSSLDITGPGQVMRLAATHTYLQPV